MLSTLQITGSSNDVADTLSHFQMKRFRSWAPDSAVARLFQTTCGILTTISNYREQQLPIPLLLLALMGRPGWIS